TATCPLGRSPLLDRGMAASMLSRYVIVNAVDVYSRALLIASTLLIHENACLGVHRRRRWALRTRRAPSRTKALRPRSYPHHGHSGPSPRRNVSSKPSVSASSATIVVWR